MKYWTSSMKKYWENIDSHQKQQRFQGFDYLMTILKIFLGMKLPAKALPRDSINKLVIWTLNILFFNIP